MLDASIIIPCYNGQKYIASIKSVLEPYFKKKAEVIFVNDGSTDNSLELLKDTFPQCKILEQKNKGVAAARNAGAKLSTRHYLQFLDIDDEISPDKIESQIAFANEKDYDIVYSDWQMVIVNESAVEKEPPNQSGLQNDIRYSLIADWWQPPHSYLVSKKAYLDVGGSDESLINAQDFELFTRLALYKFKFGYLPGLHSFYYRYNSHSSLARGSRWVYWQSYEKSLEKLLQISVDNHLLSTDLRKAFAIRLFLVARNTYSLDKAWNKRIINKINNIYPQFIPPQESFAFKFFYFLFGYYNAERFSQYIKTKRTIYPLSLLKKEGK